MPVVIEWVQGSPTWLDLATSDEQSAIEFYGSLFGWTSEANDAGNGAWYHMQRQGDAYVCGIFQPPPERAMPPCWTTYISVDDVDAATAQAAAEGGQVYMQPFDVMENGRMSVVADPTGGVISLWQDKRGTGGTLMGEPYSRCWSELMTPDRDRAIEFFKAMFGVETDEMPGPGGMPYVMLKVGGQPVIGVVQKTPEMPIDLPVFWLNYFAVEDCDATAQKAAELGGSVIAGPWDTMPGRMALLADRQGASFGIIKLDQPG